MSVALLYIGLCFIIALVGAKRKFGFWGYFFCSLFLSPFIGALVLLGSDERPKPPKNCPHCVNYLPGTKKLLR